MSIKKKSFACLLLVLLLSSGCTSLSGFTLGDSAGTISPLILSAVVLDHDGERVTKVHYGTSQAVARGAARLHVEATDLMWVSSVYVSATTDFSARIEVRETADKVFEIDLADIPFLQNRQASGDESVSFYVLAVDVEDAKTVSRELSLELAR